MMLIDTGADKPITAQEWRLLKAFRTVSNDGRRFVLEMAEGEVRITGKRERPVLSLVQGGPQAVPIRKRRRDRALAP
jgi:hypothetical protein